MPLPLLRRLALAHRVLVAQWFQPATALWRLFEAEAVREHLSAHGRALDLGCGDGTLAPVLLERAGPGRWTGADLDPAEVALARSAGLYRGLAAASAEALPFRAGSLDVVFANSALEHMDDLDRVLAEAARALRRGGMLAFTVPAAGFHGNLFWPRLLQRLGRADAAARYLEHLDRRLRHLRYPSEPEWREALARHGLALDRAVPYLSRRATATWETLSNATGGLAHRLHRGRRTPREVQLRAGVQPAPSPVLGTFAFLLLFPVLLWTCFASHRRPFSALYVEAHRPGTSAPTTEASP